MRDMKMENRLLRPVLRFIVYSYFGNKTKPLQTVKMTYPLFVQIPVVEAAYAIGEVDGVVPAEAVEPRGVG